jgi:indolepyruvate ferredoxin oxidoreductase alpha subunit
MTLAYLGVGAGMVVICADDPFCHSSQNEQDSRRYAQFASIPCLDPADPQEAKEMAVFAFDLSERFNIPVMLRPTTRVSHSRADVEFGAAKALRGDRQFVKNPARRVALPVHARPLHTELIKKQAVVEEALQGKPWNRLTLRGRDGIIASGIAGLYAEETILDLDLDVSLLRIGTYPVPSQMIARMLEQVRRVMIVEELEPVVEEQVERLARRINPGVEILGKDGYIPRDGELNLLTVRDALARMMGIPVLSAPRIAAEKILPPRPPALCPGCSHRATYYAMRTAFGKKAVYPSDIGCYTMAVGMGTVDTCLCMGAAITLASGIRFGGESEGICCSLGDSTFLHGGMTGLLNAAYNKARITVTILDNSTTAMTGHQPHPGTGVTVTGEPTVPVSLEALAKALGAGLVETVDPYDPDKAVEGFRRAKEFPGLSVVIARQPCVIKARRGGARRRVFVVGEECAGCRICVDFGCPAISFDKKKKKVSIDPMLCVGCALCIDVCQKGAIS